MESLYLLFNIWYNSLKREDIYIYIYILSHFTPACVIFRKRFSVKHIIKMQRPYHIYVLGWKVAIIFNFTVHNGYKKCSILVKLWYNYSGEVWDSRAFVWPLFHGTCFSYDNPGLGPPWIPIFPGLFFTPLCILLIFKYIYVPDGRKSCKRDATTLTRTWSHGMVHVKVHPHQRYHTW